MIRLATKYDKTNIIEMMKEFRQEANLPEYADCDNPEYWDLLLDRILAGMGVIFIAEGKGLLMAMIQPTIWDHRVHVMHELAWFVRPEYRRGSTAYRLLSEYLAYGRKLKEEGRIKFFTMSKLDITPNLDYTKYGFRKKDENWIQ